MTETNLNPETLACARRWTGVGRFVQVHTIGDIDIVEYRDPRTGAGYFAVYVAGRDAHTLGSTLDYAVAIAIARKHDGPGSRAADYFMRGIGADSPPGGTLAVDVVRGGAE